MSDATQKPSDESRRNFIKIGAGAVAGAVVVGGATALYYNGVVGTKNTDINTLQSKLNAANSQVTSLTSQLNAAKSQESSLTSQLAAAKSQVTSLTSQLSTETSNYNAAQSSITTLKTNVSTLTGQLSTATSQVNSLTSQLATATSQANTLTKELATAQSQVTSLTGQVSSLGGQDALITLGVQEAAVVEAAAQLIIPTDSNGPGASTAGAIYFIDRQLFGDYGTNGRMYMKGPFIMPNTPGPLIVNSTNGTPITYSQGTPKTPWAAGQTYAYGFSMRNFWHFGIAALETYCTTAYGGAFETLSAANQLAALTDLFNNKPTSFNSLIPSDFANELFFMVWSGFTMDPMYGGNRGMVGWTLTASPGMNNGNFYGEGFTPQQRMVASTPQILKPASLAQFQQSLGIKGVQGGT